MKCQGSQFNALLKDCTCPRDFIVVEKQIGGQWVKECSACVAKAYPGPAENRVVTTCKLCPNEGQSYNELKTPWQCECNAGNGNTNAQYIQAGNKCLLTSVTGSLPSDSKQIEYKNVETRNKNDGTSSLTSGALDYYYTQSVVGCQSYEDPQACQQLANLCVLNLYNPGSMACKQFNRIVESLQHPNLAYPESYNDRGWKEGMPWLYYRQTASDVLFKDQKVKFRASFKYENLDIGVVNQLRFKIAEYELDGTFNGFSDLTDQLILCAQPQDELQRLYNIGTTVQISCTYDLSKLISSNEYEVPRKANRFYELYLEDYNGFLIDIPVLIANVNSEQSDFPNREPEVSRWVLTRRFFLFDTISGITLEDWPNGTPQVIRYVKTFILKINLDTENEEMINSPYLYIDYRERTASYIEEDSLTRVQFNSEYILSTDAFWEGASACFWAFMGLFVLILLIVTCVQIDRPALQTDLTARFQYITVKSCMNALDIFSTLMFWYLFAATGYWFIFFKLQERVYCFLPELDSFKVNYEPYDILFGLVCSSKLVFVTFKIYFEQSAYDIFLIDWERPKFQEHTLTEDRDKSSGVGNSRSKFDVNAWRSLFLLNELNELQTTKLISTDFTLLTYAVLMEGFGFKFWTSHSPYIENKDYNSPLNYCLFFFVTTIIIYSVGVAQYVFRYFPPIRNNFPMKHVEFTDLCSITNISILMFDESFHGYYIHGRSPYGQAEVSTEMLKLALEFESSGKAHMRGISETDPELQTFEIFIPMKLMSHYRMDFMQEVEQGIQNKNTENTQLYNTVQRTLHRSPAIPVGLNLEDLEISRRVMNKIMMQYVEQVRMNPSLYIRDRSWIQRLLNRAPKKELNSAVPIMFKDNWGAFSSTMLMGMDFDFLMLDVVIITFMERETQRHPDVTSREILAVLIAFVLDHMLFWLRRYFGRRNLSKHTLADEAFLI